MRVLVLIIQFPPDVNSSGMLMAQLCEGLRARGHSISVITTFPHYARFRIEDEYRGKLAARASYRDMDVLRLYVYTHGSKQRMMTRLLSYLSFNVAATIAGLASREKYDVILCSNGSFFSGLAATVIGAIRRIPYVYNVQDLYPETPVQAGQLRNRLAIRILEALERFMYSTAAHVSVISPGFRRNILDKGIPPERVSMIPNFVDTQFIRPLEKDNAFSHQYGLVGKFVVTHAGNVGYVYDLETLLDAAALLRNEKDIVFLIVGEGVARDSLHARAEALELTNVRFLPFQPREHVPLLRAASDVQLALYKRGSSRYSMPSKVYEIMASARPVLASADWQSDLWALVTDVGCGVCVEPDEPEKLAAAVLELRSNPRQRAEMGRRGRQEAERSYSLDAVVTRYDELIHAVASPRS